MAPATMDAARMDVLATAATCGSANERFVTKMAMVKPTPPKAETPTICPHWTPFGREEKPRRTVIHVARKMPRGLPTSRPREDTTYEYDETDWDKPPVKRLNK